MKDDWKDKIAQSQGGLLLRRQRVRQGAHRGGAAGTRKEIGVDLVDEEIVPGAFQDATSQLLNMKQKGADYAYINVTTTGVSTVLRDAKKLGPEHQVRLQPVRLQRGAARRWRRRPPKASPA